jgi:hypothetical protein
MPDQSEKLMQLEPVNFTFKNDPTSLMQYGLIAEDAGKIYPELLAYDKDGQIFSINYFAFIPILIAQIQHQEREIQQLKEQQQFFVEQEETMQELQKEMTQLKALVSRLIIKK